MDANRLLPRAIGALIFLLITALLLNHTSLLQPNFARIKDPSDRSNPIDSIKSNLQSIKLLFRRHDYACNLTSPSTKGRFVQSHLLARNRPLDYGTAICDGRRNWKMITDAFAGRYPPGREFTFEDVDNGWNYNENPQFLEKRWQAPLRYISNQLNDVPDNTVPDPEDTHYVEMMQDKEFVNDQEKMTVNLFLSFPAAFSLAPSLPPYFPRSNCSRLRQPPLTPSNSPQQAGSTNP